MSKQFRAIPTQRKRNITLSIPSIRTWLQNLGFICTLAACVGGCLSWIPSTFAAAVVESRTGTPNVRTAPASSQGTHYGTQTYPQAESNRTFTPRASSATPASSAEERAARMTLSQIETLQRELGELRGVIETQEHEIKQLKKSQQDLYLDLDRRLNQLTQKTTTSPNTKAQKSTTNPKTPETKPSQGSVSEKATSAASTASKAKAAGSLDLVSSGGVNSHGSKGKEAHGNNETSDSSSPASTCTNPVTSKSESSQASKEQEAYQAAYAFVRTKRYPEAISALQDYLSDFPKGTNNAPAHYWLGEVYMVQWQADKSNPELLDKASEAFTTLSKDFAQHPKAVDALLKLGIIEVERGNIQGAEQYFTEVKTKHPGTAAARIAESRLQKLAAD